MNRNEVTSSLDQRNIDTLRSSLSITGPLQSVIKCEQHKDIVLIGRHREATGAGDLKVEYFDVETLARKLEIPHEAAEEVVRINGNSQRRVRKEETRMRVNTLAKQLQTTGVPDEDVATRLGKILPFTQAYIDSLLSSEFKRRDHVHSPGRPSRGLQYSVNPEKRLPDSERVATSQEYVDASNGPTLLTTGATQAEALRSLSNPIFQEKFAIWSKTIAAISAVSAGIFPSGAQKASLKVTGNPTNVFALLMKIAPEFDMKDRVELQLALEDGQ